MGSSCQHFLIGLFLALPPLQAVAESDTVQVRILSRYHPTELAVETERGEVAALDSSSSYPVRFPAGPRYQVRVPGREPRYYTGALEAWWSNGEIVLVNRAPLEDYVAGVVNAELGRAPPAALRAQGVIARTWALRHASKRRIYSFGDLANDQVFHGFPPDAEQVAQALDATRGIVLTYRGRAIDAVYHAECADRVYGASEIWGGGGHDYLVPVELPETIASTAERRWTRRLPRKRIDPLFRTAAGQHPRYRVRWRDGRLGVNVVPGEWIGIDHFRLTVERALGWNTLRSNAFTITVSGDDLIFQGEGFGHLVGLCQVQAAQLAAQGWTYEEILRLFYPGARLTQVR